MKVLSHDRPGKDSEGPPVGGVHIRWMMDRAKSVIQNEGVVALLRRMKHRLGTMVRGDASLLPYATRDVRDQYRRWSEQHSMTRDRMEAMKRELNAFAACPVLSFAMPLADAQTSWVSNTIDSFLHQLYPHWKLYLYGPEEIHQSLIQVAKNAALQDSRIAFSGDGGIGTRGFVETLCSRVSGTFVGLMHSGNELAPEALFEIAQRINQCSDTDVIFSDHDVIAPDGEYVDPFFKPGWNPDLLLSINYLSPLCLVRRTALMEIPEVEGSLAEDRMHAVLLRVTERARRIEHIPHVLCHAGPCAAPDRAVAGDDMRQREGTGIVAEALHRRGEFVHISVIGPDRYHVSFLTRGAPLVSIIVPTRDRCDLLRRCISSIETHTREVRYEIIVLDNGSTEEGTRRFLDSIGSWHRVIQCPGPFNYSAINNEGVVHASGEYVLFLNNDTEALEPAWLSTMLAQAQRPGVGAVGAKLLYPDGRIQHAGVVLGVCGVAGHAFRYLRPEDKPYHGLSELPRNCSAVTAACLLMPKKLFEQIGGFNTRLKIEYNDVDLCLRIRQHGFRIVFDPHVVLIHHENATRKSGRSPEDRLVMEELWGSTIKQGDPYYNPNLTTVREDWSLRL
jgi:GT2 family glycosyltransferase